MDKEAKKERDKKYYQENKEVIKARCKKYREEHKEYYKLYKKRYYQENKERETIRKKEYWKKHKEYYKKHSHAWYEEFRLKTLNTISNNNPVCVQCGCDDIRMLEINHVNGGGCQETKGGTYNFYASIVNGTRKIDDLEILCGLCHSLYHFELKYGKLPYKIYYNNKKGD